MPLILMITLKTLKGLFILKDYNLELWQNHQTKFILYTREKKNVLFYQQNVGGK